MHNFGYIQVCTRRNNKKETLNPKPLNPKPLNPWSKEPQSSKPSNLKRAKPDARNTAKHENFEKQVGLRSTWRFSLSLSARCLSEAERCPARKGKNWILAAEWKIMRP